MKVTQTTYGIQRKKIIEQLPEMFEKFLIIDNGSLIKTETDGVFFLDPSNENIQSWGLPLLFDNNGETSAVIDVRDLWQGNSIPPKNKIAFDLLRTVASLEVEWETNRHSFGSVIDAAACVYGQWIGNLFSSRFNLGPENTEVVRLTMAVYYRSLYELDKVKSYSEGSGELLVRRFASRYLGQPTDFISNVLAREDSDGKTLLSLITSTSETDLLDRILSWLTDVCELEVIRLNISTLFNMAPMNGWLGHHASMYSLTALEHPPVLIALIDVVNRISFYEKKTKIGTAVRSTGRQANTKDISRWLHNVRVGLEGLTTDVHFEE